MLGFNMIGNIVKPRERIRAAAGESSVVGTNKSGAYKPLLTLGWGFSMKDDINGKHFSIPRSQKTFPIKIVDPSDGHLRLIRKKL